MTTQEAQKSAYQNRAAKSREKYQQELAAYNANKKAAAKADAAPAAEAAPSKKRKKLCVFQNFTARDSPVDFHTGKKSEDGGEKKKVAFRRGRLEPSKWTTGAFKFMSTRVFPPQRGLFMRFHRCTFHTEKEEEQEEGCVAEALPLR